MAKKKHKKKHNFQHKNAPSVVAAPIASGSSGAQITNKSNTMPNEWSEVSADVRRALILAAIFIGVMIGLWYFLDVTPYGKHLYDSIKI